MNCRATRDATTIDNSTKMTPRQIVYVCFLLFVSVFELNEACPSQDPATFPLSAKHMYVSGLHFYSNDMHRQVPAHHYCHEINPDFQQCILFDKPSQDAKLIGIEYMVSRKLFDTFPEEEKALWHFHTGEVKEGLISVPGASPDEEKKIMEKLINTYGKTFHMWQIDKDASMPLGIPQLMMAFANISQVNATLLENIQTITCTNVEHAKQRRMEIPSEPKSPYSDAWMNGVCEQVVLSSQRLAPSGEVNWEQCSMLFPSLSSNSTSAMKNNSSTM